MIARFLLLAAFVTNACAESWCDAPPAPEVAALKLAEVQDDWFKIFAVAPGVFAITEPRQLEGVSSFLIVGSKRAILFDSGLGVGRIGEVVKKLTVLPVTVLNSHTHFDHVGGNREFEDVRNLDEPYSAESARGEISDELRTYAKDMLAEDRVCGSLPAGVKSRDYIIPTWRTAAHVRDGERLDLGDRTVEVLRTPGHTPDSLCLLDAANGLLFTGDTYYSGEVFLWAPETVVADYTASITRLVPLAPGLRLLLPAHGSPVADPNQLVELQKALQDIEAGSARSETTSAGRRLFKFEHFSILMNEPRVPVDRDVAVRMRDGVVLRADVYRPARSGRFPTLVFRTPYGKHYAARSDGVHLKAVERGYAVVMQDVRGRYASEGTFEPYRQEGADGYDTIEWAAAQPWSDGRIGTYGLSYPGAVQWLAAVEAPPHLLAMAPAMTFSSPRRFFYMNGIFDRSWLPWIYQNVAPDARRRLGLPVGGDAEQDWPTVAAEYQSWLPLRELPWLRKEAPYYFEWLARPPEDPWWDWAELRGRYARVSAAVLNLSGWFDDAYGVEGAATNFNGLKQARSGPGGARTHLMIGPWVHGVPSPTDGRAGDLDFGHNAPIDYDQLVLDFHDHYLRGIANRFADDPPVRYFVMGANEWRNASGWPPPDSRNMSLYLDGAEDDIQRRLRPTRTVERHSESVFAADPEHPIADAYGTPGAHDYGALESRKDLLTFDTEPLTEDLWVAGNISAQIYASCDCRDFDLWVRLLDVHPDGRAFNLMSPGNDVLRASYRDPEAGRQPLDAGRIYELRLLSLMTSIRFAKGHRIRAQISASFDPHLSRNLQTGESEIVSAASRVATITIHHGTGHASRLELPVPAETD